MCDFGLEGIEACPCWLILDNRLGVPDPISGFEDTLAFFSGPFRRSTNDLRGCSCDGVFGVKSSARARLFVVGVNDGVEVEGVKRDSRDGAFGGASASALGISVGVGVDAERIERP